MLGDLIATWKSKTNSQVIAMGDWNTPYDDKDFILWKNKLGLVDAIAKHISPGKPPPTWDRGTKAIDSICTTSRITVEAAAYLPFGKDTGDHRAQYIDVKMESVLGIKIPSYIKPNARKLELQDLRVVKNYNDDFTTE